MATLGKSHSKSNSAVRYFTLLVIDQMGAKQRSIRVDVCVQES